MDLTTPCMQPPPPHSARAALRRARLADAREIGAKLLVGGELVEQAALEPAAVPEEPVVRQGHVLGLRHLHRDRLELPQPGGAAELAAARGPPAPPKSTRSSALNRTVTRRPSGWMSTSTTFRWRLFCRARSWQVTTARLSRSRRSRQSLASEVVAFRITFRNRRSRLDSGGGRLGRRTSPMAVPVAVSTTQKSPTWRSNSSTRYSSAWSGSRSLIPIRYRGLISTVGVSVSIAILIVSVRARA